MATAIKEFVISREFAAPRELLFRCFADAEHMRHWCCPKGFTVFRSVMDLRLGSTYHYGMRSPQGQDM